MTTFADKARRAVTGALTTESDLPIAEYDRQTAEDIIARLRGFTQRELLQIDAYERKHQNRSTITDRIDALRGDEPWPGYDEQGVDGIAHALREVSTDTARRVRDYERAHQERTGVLDATESRLNAA